MEKYFVKGKKFFDLELVVFGWKNKGQTNMDTESFRRFVKKET